MTTSLESRYAYVGYEVVAKTGISLPWILAKAYGKAFRVLSESDHGIPVIADGPQARSLALLLIFSLLSDLLAICFCSLHVAFCILYH